MAERDVLHDIREALGMEPDLVLWRNNRGTGILVPVTSLKDLLNALRRGLCGLALSIIERLGVRPHAYGLDAPGSADLVGILRWPDERGVGIFFALEVKSGRGRTSEEQERWLALVRRMGGFAAVVHSVQEAKSALDRARKGESQ